MAKALAETEPIAAETLALADEVLGFRLSKLMADGPEDALTVTENAQPAILAHSIAVLRVIEERLGRVTFSAGHSLGEFSAHVAAGTFSFSDALKIVRLRGELMHASGTRTPGTMAAILGLSDKVVADVCARVTTGTCVPANFNSRGQVVVSGDISGVDEGIMLAREAGAKRALKLKVSGAFHSPLMESAAKGLGDRLDSTEMRDPEFPVVSNVTADLVNSAEEAHRLLVQQLTSPVRWRDSITTMLEAGVRHFIELGPGGVLCGLNRKNAKGIPCHTVGEPNDVEAFDE
ncbi:MAG: ACP S-malonyltransferase [Gemmatimonadetes bacterium]|jgi:[acyl-carrier-protein] S-malonyltransferase|nr:ACP S-malonyltransferase [Gemmatimonadota bacterium]|tara:strand:+ start:173 stop:1042 length:870 start_codon:yes stop_codon:yes gene_type:complete